jgi:hypothetical protein
MTSSAAAIPISIILRRIKFSSTPYLAKYSASLACPVSAKASAAVSPPRHEGVMKQRRSRRRLLRRSRAFGGAPISDAGSRRSGFPPGVAAASSSRRAVDAVSIVGNALAVVAAVVDSRHRPRRTAEGAVRLQNFANTASGPVTDSDVDAPRCSGTPPDFVHPVVEPDRS